MKLHAAVLFVALTAHCAIAAGPAPSESDSPLTTAELVKTHRNTLVFVTGEGAGSGFVADFGGRSFLVTNAHVAAGVKGAGFRTLDGTQVKVGAASSAVAHDIFLMQATGATGKPFEVMKGVDEGTSIGDEVVVLGNAEGAGVINTISGKIVGVGPNLVEVDAPFQPGNSGSPIIHLKTGKVIGVATYLMIKNYDAATRTELKAPVVRRFGYRLDSVKTWQPINWQAFYAQAAEMEKIETLTDDLGKFLIDLGKDSRVSAGMHTNPVIKTRIDSWLSDKRRRLSAKDAASVDQNFISFLKVTCRADVTAAKPRMTYDYFQRALADQQRARDQLADIFDKIIKEIQKER